MHSTRRLSPVTRTAHTMAQHPTGNALATVGSTFHVPAPVRACRTGPRLGRFYLVAICTACVAVLRFALTGSI
jgi:hypothetical protein